MIYLFIFLVALGLCTCVWAFSSCAEQGLLFTGVQWFPLLWSMVCRLMGFSSCGAWAWLPCGMWNLPEPGIEPVSPAVDAYPLYHQGGPQMEEF